MSRILHPPGDAPIPDVPVDDAWFAAATCRSCGAPRATPHCGACGQAAAVRLAWRDIGRETWDRIRLFEFKAARTLGALVIAPGSVARDYVMGRRDAHMHPLKLLVALVAVLVLVLATNQYFAVYDFAGRNSDVDRMAQRVLALANWSFSIGIVAIFLGSRLGFGRRLGYNSIEHGVLAIYCQSIILAAIVLNLLPTLIWRSPEFVLWHKSASQYYMYVIKLAVVTIAYRQFFLLDLRRDWPRLLLACAIYAAASWVLLRIYALAIFWLVTGTM